MINKGPGIMPATGTGHYSGANPVPTIKKFVESLDRDKARRDREIDESNQAPKPHTPTKAGKAGTKKTVTDPTTGKSVVIEDVDQKTMESVKHPTVSATARGEQQ